MRSATRIQRRLDRLLRASKRLSTARGFERVYATRWVTIWTTALEHEVRRTPEVK